jgi:CRISPR system Cascade subunit CasA
MKPRFNLLEEAWIPCVNLEGQPVECSLSEVLLKAHQLREIATSSPLVTVAVYRLLLALLHRIFGPENRDVWQKLWRKEQWDEGALQSYFEHWHQRFDLFDEVHPFYQAADERVEEKSVTSLVLDIASGNMATLFDHHTDKDGMELSPDEAAQALIAIQAFGLAGLSGLEQKFTDGPCARGINFILTGKNLFETLALNLMPYNEYSPTENLCWNPKDKPAWEMDDPFEPDREIPLGYLDYLTWQNRRVLFQPEEQNGEIIVRAMTMAPALQLNRETVLNPMQHYRKDEKRGYLMLRFQEGKALWRDSSSLFALRSSVQNPPASFHWFSELQGEGILNKNFMQAIALGMANNQAKVEFYCGEQFILPRDYLADEELIGILTTQLDRAQQVRNQLWGSARTLASLLLSPEADLKDGRQPDPKDMDNLTTHWNIEQRYWGGLALPFYALLNDLPADRMRAVKIWERIIRKQAGKALSHALQMAGNSTAALKAGAKANRQLQAGLKKIWPEEQKEAK